MAHDLQPPEPSADIKTALTDYLANLSGSDLPNFTVNIDVADAPAEVAQTTYLVLLEGTSNVVRHARATSATLSAFFDSDHLQLEVRDDGIGLTQPYVSGVGINSMRRRIETLGGTFSIQPAPGRGTQLSASIPLRVTLDAGTSGTDSTRAETLTDSVQAPEAFDETVPHADTTRAPARRPPAFS